MASPGARADSALRGQVVASFGRRFLVELDGSVTVSCVARGRRRGIACGDNVRLTRISATEGVIEDIEPRTCLLYRSDEKREKAIAANITQVVVVVAIAPAPNAEFIDRCLAAAEHAGARSLLVLNKTDLDDPGEQASRISARYGALGYRTVPASMHSGIEHLLAELRGHLSVLIGQSGVGKSTLVNRLVPDANARVAGTSATRDAGRHTTTRAQLYRIDAQSALVDSPGMHAFGLNHVDAADLSHAFIEFRRFLGDCRFSNCRHDGEPGCAVDAAARDGRVLAERLASYRRILKTLA
ncbi:MAG: ribosome small subunit-dependent GTPase A [Betaproteobacteria bacterium]|nr:MAG: ribosome small subunit-dependent GTPase A [Betaproteobacteria bacterium]